jgi:hypothetical protein
MTTWGGKSDLTTVLSVKLTEVLYIPRAWHWFPILRSQADASRAAYSGYPEGTFPAGGKLVHALPVKDPPEHQIVHLEPPAWSAKCRSGFKTLPSVPLLEQYRCGSFVGGAQIAVELANREYGGHQDLRGSGRRSVIPYVHG